MTRTSLIRTVILYTLAAGSPAFAGSMTMQIDACVESSLSAMPQASLDERADFVRRCVSDPGATRDLFILAYISACKVDDQTDPTSIVSCARAQEINARPTR